MNIDKPHKYKYHDFGDTRKTKDCWCGLHKEDPLHIMSDKNAKDNRINKEGFDAGYKKGKKDLINEIKKQLPEYLLKMVDLERILNKLNKK